MLTFFRRIRKGLLGDGAVSKYLLYAIGEILLVMIGILLALYVNNINEQRKQISKGFDVMREIQKNLESNSTQFQSEVDLELKVISSIDIVLSNVRETKTYHDSLNQHFHMAGYWPTSSWETSGYESLKKIGVESIKSEYLRNSIIELYEMRYPELSEIVRNSEGYSYSTLIPVLSQLFIFEKSDVGQNYIDYEASPFDYDQVQKSEQLQGVLSFWRLVRVIGVQSRMKIIEENNQLIEQIKVELNSGSFGI